MYKLSFIVLARKRPKASPWGEAVKNLSDFLTDEGYSSCNLKSSPKNRIGHPSSVTALPCHLTPQGEGFDAVQTCKLNDNLSYHFFVDTARKA